MQDAPFYLSIFAISTVLAQVPEIGEFRELSATVILGVLFWYTLTRVNGTVGKLTEAIVELRETIVKESERKKE